MKTEDTRDILQECDAGVKTAVDCIDAVIDKTGNEGLRAALQTSRTEHVKLGNEIASLLDSNGFPGKDPNLIAKMMSKTKIAAELTLSPTDSTVAELMIDGCNMGIKKLSEYINRFPTATGPAVRISERLIKTEQELMDAMRVYL
jgi:hypothetical protein